MSKPKKKEPEQLVGFNTHERAYVVSEYIVDRINGNIFEILEAMGLSDKQYDSAKNLVRKATWSSFEDAITLRPERFNKVLEEHYNRLRMPLDEQRNPDWKSLP